MEADLTKKHYYKCAKCSHNQYRFSEFRATGGFWTKLFNIQSKRFTTVICEHCSYTEIYSATESDLVSVLDFFVG